MRTLVILRFGMRLILLALSFIPCEGFYARAAEANSFPFSFDRLRQQAAKLAESAYAPPSRPLPDFLGKLSYDEYQVLSPSLSIAVCQRCPASPLWVARF